MSAGPKELTDPPTNLKEAIDWLVLVGRGFGGNIAKGWSSGKHKELETALNDFKDFTASYNRRFKYGSLSEIICIFAQGLGYGFLGYNGRNSETVSGSGIIASNKNYKSTYRACNWSSDYEPDYAKIFLFLAILVHYLITFLYWMCKSSDKWANKMLSDNSVPFSKFFEAMGYTPSQLDQQKTGTTIASALNKDYQAFPELQTAYQGGEVSSYDAFLKKLEANVVGSPLNHPLASCRILCYAYLQSRHSGTDITQAIDAIKTKLVSLSTSLTSSSTFATDYFSKLKKHISSLLGKIHTFDPNSASSSVAPLASALTTLTAAGGAGAAYGLNLFGLQGIVKALFGFK
ncbi:variant erythrocyte surface antigen-1, beta subunit [Babesia caballi]|uniref:Variant erythrocyte surface antigen-1, beta subunit n=1 Tax=Babesia caballi TaxID=5871 RepID=A0AAV4M1R7_BABCB|nr:variant erythrocyte surface antigen-1, beta subunit [Babesia caballi]